jgi:putative hydrolase
VTQEPFGEIPLFREIQRLLASGGGPVNKEIARQVAGAIVAGAGADPAPTPEEARALAEVIHHSEALVAGYTRLPLDEPLLAEPVTSTLEAWEWLFKHLATRFSGELGRIGSDGDERSGSMQAAMAQIAPLLMGIQVGTVLGHLGKETLGRHDMPIPRDDDGHIFVVVSNVDSLATGYGLDGRELNRWVAMQETARSLVGKRSRWVNKYFRGLLIELIDSIEIDVGALEQRLIELQSGGIEAVQEGLGDASLPVVASPRHQSALRRVQAFIAIFEGYANHACKQVAGEILKDPHKVDEVMARRAVSASDGEALLTGLIGLSFDRALEQSGTTFCAAVISLKGLEFLNRVWEAADNLPSLDEIKDPFAWMERVE